MKANKEKILIAIILLIQTIIFIIAGISKSYIHMDEAFSMGLTNYPEINIIFIINGMIKIIIKII